MNRTLVSYFKAKEIKENLSLREGLASTCNFIEGCILTPVSMERLWLIRTGPEALPELPASGKKYRTI